MGRVGRREVAGFQTRRGRWFKGLGKAGKRDKRGMDRGSSGLRPGSKRFQRRGRGWFQREAGRGNRKQGLFQVVHELFGFFVFKAFFVGGTEKRELVERDG